MENEKTPKAGPEPAGGEEKPEYFEKFRVLIKTPPNSLKNKEYEEIK